jgi:uncharacterized protein involved in outer membrane biogenesis
MKALFKLVVGLVVVVVLSAVVALLVFDPNDYKDWIADKAKQRTGRELTLGGDIKLTYYPWLGVELNDVTLSNAEGFGDQPFLHVDTLRTRIKTLPLLRDQYEIDTVVLHGAQLNLARDKDGNTNWADLAAGEPAESKPLPLTAIVLGGVDIQKTGLTWNDAASGASYEVKDLALSTGELTYGAPIDMTMSMNVVSKAPALQGAVKMNGTVNYDVDAGLYSIKPLKFDGTLAGKSVPGGSTALGLAADIEANTEDDSVAVQNLKLDALGSEVIGELKMGRVQSGKPVVDAVLEVKGEDIALWFKVLEVEPLAGQLAQLKDRRFELKTRLAADMAAGNVEVPELSARLLGATVNGQFKAANALSGTPSVNGTLDAAGPDLPTLAQVLGQVQGGRNSPLSRAGKAMAVTSNRAFAVKTQFDADLKNGTVSIPTLSADLLGVKLTAKVESPRAQSYQGSVDASGASLPELMQIAGRMDGTKDSALATMGAQLGKHSQRAFTLKSGFNADTKGGNIDIPAITASALGINLEGNLKARDMSGSGGSVDGKLQVTGTQLTELLTAIDQAGLGETLKAVRFEAVIKGDRRKMSLSPMELSASVASPEIKNSPVKIALKADTDVNLDAEELNLADFTLTGLGLNVQGDLKAQKILSAPEATGKVTVGEFNLKQLMAQLKMKPPRTADREVLKKVALQTQFASTPGSLALNSLKATVDDTVLKGDVSVGDYDKPVVRFNIEVDGIDADRYRLPEPAGKEAAAVAADDAKVGRLPVALLKTLDVDGSFKLGKLVLAKVRMNSVAFNVKGKNGVIRLDPITAKLYQGTFSGNLGIDATGKLPKITFNPKLENIQAEPLLKDLRGNAKLRGTGNFSGALVAAGANTNAMKKTLNGQMAFSFRDGAIKGYNLGKLMRQGSSLKDHFSLKVSDKEETDFSEITGNPIAQNGVIRMDDLAGKSPALRIGGKGVIADLPRNQIDYLLTAVLVATSKGQGGKEVTEGKLEGIPLDCKIKGSLDAPERDCDASKLVAAMGVKLLQGLGVLPETKDPTAKPGTTTKKKSANPLDSGKKLLEDVFK